jgi:hypothetical protein
MRVKGVPIASLAQLNGSHERNAMLLVALQTELTRLQLHPVNLTVAAKDDPHVALRGSLLQYWKVPAVVDGEWLLGILQGLPDAAGAAVVMKALSTAQHREDQSSKTTDSAPTLRVFDPIRNENNGK